MCPSQCLICAQHVYKLGHSLYTEATAWPPLVHWSCIHACAQAWAHVYISKQFPSLGTPTFTAVKGNHWGVGGVGGLDLDHEYFTVQALL